MGLALPPSSVASFSAFANVLSATMTFSPPAVRFFANWEPMFPRPMIAVFMIIRFLVYGSLKSARAAAWGCHPMFCRDRSYVVGLWIGESRCGLGPHTTLADQIIGS